MSEIYLRFIEHLKIIDSIIYAYQYEETKKRQERLMLKKQREYEKYRKDQEDKFKKEQEELDEIMHEIESNYY